MDDKQQTKKTDLNQNSFGFDFVAPMPDAENSTVRISHILAQGRSMKMNTPSQTLTDQDEDELALLMGDDECLEDIEEALDLLCAIDRNNGCTTDPIRKSMDQFATYYHFSNGRIEAIIHATREHRVIQTSADAQAMSSSAIVQCSHASPSQKANNISRMFTTPANGAELLEETLPSATSSHVINNSSV